MLTISVNTPLLTTPSLTTPSTRTTHDRNIEIVKKIAVRGDNSIEVREGGELDGKTFRVNGYIWFKFDNDANSFKVSIAFDNTADTIANIRKLREYQENTEHTQIVSYEFTGGKLHSSVEDELAKVIMPTKGFAAKQFIRSYNGEPYFVLLGRDLQAPNLLREWANIRMHCTNPRYREKAEEAFKIAGAMEKYRQDRSTIGISEQELGDARAKFAVQEK